MGKDARRQRQQRERTRARRPEAAALADRANTAVDLIVASLETNLDLVTTDTVHPTVDLAGWPAVRRTAIDVGLSWPDVAANNPGGVIRGLGNIDSVNLSMTTCKDVESTVSGRCQQASRSRSLQLLLAGLWSD